MTPALVRPQCRSRSNWVLSVLSTDSKGLAEGAEEPPSGPGFLRLGGRTYEGDTGLVEGLLEAGPPITLVRDDGLARRGEVGTGQHLEGDVAFVCFGRCQRPGYGQTRCGGQKVETQPPEVSGMRRAPSVLGPACQRGAAGGFSASAALDRCRVHHPEAILERWRELAEMVHDVLQHPGAAPQPLVISRPGRQIREPGPQMIMRPSQKPGF